MDLDRRWLVVLLTSLPGSDWFPAEELAHVFQGDTFEMS